VKAKTLLDLIRPRTAALIASGSLSANANAIIQHGPSIPAEELWAPYMAPHESQVVIRRWHGTMTHNGRTENYNFLQISD
jgi:hypothetical protein